MKSIISNGRKLIKINDGTLQHPNEHPKTQYPRSCIVIGSSTLAIFCAQKLIDAGHIVRIVPRDKGLTTFAEYENVEMVESVSILNKLIKGNQIDWIFSIFNNEVLSPVTIDQINKFVFDYDSGHLIEINKYENKRSSSLDKMKYLGVSWCVITKYTPQRRRLLHAVFQPGLYEVNFSVSLYGAARKSFCSLLSKLENSKAE
jgi:hypothetical protein